jgi:predicted HAD superfamily Cof-like phosphohydrolase
MTHQNNFQDVLAFHTKFEVPLSNKPSLLNDEAYNFRLNFMQEELREFVDGHYDKNLTKAFDSLIDLVYVAHGTALMMGCTPEMWQEMWSAVQSANMTKVRAVSSDESTRSTSLDVVKPANFVPPDSAIENIIKKYSK